MQSAEIQKWTARHVAASDKICAHCGHIIHTTTCYVRKVARENHPRREKRFLSVVCEHDGNCPDTCSQVYARR